MRKLWIMALTTALVGCSHAPPRVHCDGHRVRINAPTALGDSAHTQAGQGGAP